MSSQSSPYPKNSRVPLPPVTAERYSTVCRFCNVGCGYDVFVFPVDQSGNPTPGENAVFYNTIDKVFDINLQGYKADYTRPLAPLAPLTGTPWIGEGMISKTVRYNPQKKKWEAVYIEEIPSPECPVNLGNYSTRGGRNAQRIWSPFPDETAGFAVFQSRIQTPLIRWNGSLQQVSWSYAIDVAARILKYYMDNETFTYPDPVGPAAIQVLVDRADHGGGQGGGYFSDLIAGLFLQMGLATPFIRTHNRPAPTEEEAGLVEATNGNGHDNASILDESIADVLVSWGQNHYVTSTVDFIQHWLDNIRGLTVSRKQQWFDPGEPAPAGQIIIVETRPSETVHAAAAAVGVTIEEAMNGQSDQVLFVQVKPGTDSELANAVAAYIYYTYPDVVNHFVSLYRSARSNGFMFNDQTYEYYIQYLTSKSLSEWLSEAEQITGVPQNVIKKMGDMLAKPKTNSSGQTFYKRVAMNFEKGLIWSSNYTLIYAVSNLAIIIGALSGRPGSGLSRGYGHQNAYASPLPPPPPWSSNLSKGREYFIEMHVYAPQQLQSQGVTPTGPAIAEFIKKFYNEYTQTSVPKIHQYNPIVDYLIYSGVGKVLWVSTINTYKLTMQVSKFAQVVDKRAHLLQECVENTASLGIPSSSASLTSPQYNTSAVGATIPPLPSAKEYADAVISCLSGSNKVSGALFVAGDDIILPQNGILERAAHLILPSAANNGEIYEIRESGHDRRLRLNQVFHSPPGQSMPDLWIYAMIAYRIYQLYQAEGNQNSPQARRIYNAFNQIWTLLSSNMTQNSQPLSLIPQFSENYYDYNWFEIYNGVWKYYVANGPTNFRNWPYGYAVKCWAPGWSQIDLKDLEAARTIGVQVPILGKTTNPDGSYTIWGLVNYAEPAIHGKFRAEKVTINPNQSVTVGSTTLPLITREVVYLSINDIQSMFGYSWNDLLPYVINGFNPFPIPYVEIFGYVAQQKQKYKYYANNGRWDIIWQSGFVDYQNPEILQRVPYPIIIVNEQDAKNEGLQNGDIIEAYNDYGSVTGVVWIGNTVPPGQLFIAMTFETALGANQVTTQTVDPVTGNPAYKLTWVNIKKIGTLPDSMKQLTTFKPVNFSIKS